MIKKCTNKNCLLDKESSFFFKNKNTLDGYSSWCKECCKKYKINYRKNNKEKINKYNKEYIASRRNNDKFREKSNAIWRKYYYNNKVKIHKHYNEYQKDRRKKDNTYRLKQNISNTIKISLKKQKCINNNVWSRLPYTPQQLKKHLELQFASWMNWDNYGKASIDKRTWNIDHIIPQSLITYDSLDHPNFLKCWSLDNLQPLESLENIRKSNNVNG